MKKYLDFSQEFGKVDEELIAEAGKPWTIKRGDIFRLYRRKIGQAAAILLRKPEFQRDFVCCFMFIRS